MTTKNRDLGLLAAWIAFDVPLLLLVGAYASEYLFGLYPCEMCWWQRYPHMLAVLAAVPATMPIARPLRPFLTVIAAVAILVSGLIGGFHAGVEYGWWEGITHCATTVSGEGSILDQVASAPIIRCDQVQWSLFGISLAGFNFLISVATFLVIMWLLGKDRRSSRVQA